MQIATGGIQTLHRAILCTLVLVASSYVLSAVPAIAQDADPGSVEIVSDGDNLQARFYRAECEAACATLLLIPGFPGSAEPDVLGLGTRLSIEGLHVLVVNPRGLQQSEGKMTFFHTLDDIGAAFDWLHDDAVVERFGIDTSAVVVGGHSFGGGTSMAYAARDPRVRAIISLAGTDHGQLIRDYELDASFAEMVDGVLRSARAPEGPARFDPDATMRELADNQDVFGLRENAVRLANRAILLVGGWEDVNVTVDRSMLPLYRALRQEGAENVTFLVYHDNHGFGQVREHLAADVRAWVIRANDRND
jgi:pimeloyl-ACP methyl ester carboxylesterase